MTKNPTNDLVPAQPAGAMADLVAKPHIRAAIDSLSNCLESVAGKDTLTRLPTPIERSRINERSLDIRSLLSPATGSVAAMDRMAAAIGKMLGGWVNLKTASPAAVISGYTDLLKELPAWAVIATCEEFERGQAFEIIDGKERKLSPDFAPSAPRIYSLAREKLTPLYAEGRLCARLLSATLGRAPIPEAEQERVAAMFRDMADGMRMKSEAERKADRERSKVAVAEAQARSDAIVAEGNARRLARYRELGIKPVYVGERLMDADLVPLKHREKLQE